MRNEPSQEITTERYGVLLKVMIIGFISLILLIPTAMIRSLVKERQETKEEAINEIGQKWGNEQTLTGPFLTIPFTKMVEVYQPRDSTTVLVAKSHQLNVLPNNLAISSEIFPEQRYRGIFEVVVYNSNLLFEGDFTEIKPIDFGITESELELDKAYLSIGVSDLRGIDNQISLNWGDSAYVFNPGTVNSNLISSGINVPVSLELTDNNTILIPEFNFNIDLKGSENIQFVPVGKETNVQMSSAWSSPSFGGAFLPDSREVTESGFSANWNILHLNRNFPQSWIDGKHKVGESAFGLDLLLPVDNYKKTERSIKYAIMFIGLTFLVFFFIEITNSKRVHPIQYILVGLALILFYTLLLSISEHSSFTSAYLVATALTIGLITAYTKTVLKSNALTGLMLGILSILYLFIFVIIQLENYALLMGSLGLFSILAIVMFFSRKIDWYKINNTVKL